jgi:hypothetical protein
VFALHLISSKLSFYTNVNIDRLYFLSQSVAGQLKIDPSADHVNCLSESDRSNMVQITCPAPPMSPMIRIESMTPEGIDITWQTPQQFGDAQISVS